LVSVVVSFPSVLHRLQPFAHGVGERDGRDDPPGERASDDLLSGWTETASSIVTTGCLLVVLLDNGPTTPWIRPDLTGRPRRVGGGCATPTTSPDKAEVSGSSPLRPTLQRCL
jgi:hypothetical protein